MVELAPAELVQRVREFVQADLPKQFSTRTRDRDRCGRSPGGDWVLIPPEGIERSGFDGKRWSGCGLVSGCCWESSLSWRGHCRDGNHCELNLDEQ